MYSGACHWQALFLSIPSTFAAKPLVISLHFNKLLSFISRPIPVGTYIAFKLVVNQFILILLSFLSAAGPLAAGGGQRRRSDDRCTCVSPRGGGLITTSWRRNGASIAESPRRPCWCARWRRRTASIASLSAVVEQIWA